MGACAANEPQTRLAFPLTRKSSASLANSLRTLGCSSLVTTSSCHPQFLPVLVRWRGSKQSFKDEPTNTVEIVQQKPLLVKIGTQIWALSGPPYFLYLRNIGNNTKKSPSGSLYHPREAELRAALAKTLIDRGCLLILGRQADTFDLKDPCWTYLRMQAALQLSTPRTIEGAEHLLSTTEIDDANDSILKTLPVLRSFTEGRGRLKKIMNISRVVLPW